MDYTLGTKTDKKDENGSTETKKCEYICGCGKRYKYRQGLYKHKKTCTYKPHAVQQEPQNQIISTSTSEQMEILCRENKALLEQMNTIVQSLADVAKIAGNNNTISTNSHNINFYLNTHCKDAMSIQAFANQLAIDIV